MIVMKFGGTSLANAERISNVYEIVKTRLHKNPIVVVSAVSGVTDLLINVAKEASKGINPNEKTEEIINLHKKIIKKLNLNEEILIDDFIRLHDTLNGIYLLNELSLRSIDLISSFGEIFSSKIIAGYFNSKCLSSKQYAGWDAGILTNDNFTNSEILEETYEIIKNKLNEFNEVPIVTGFIAKNKDGEITTLGRGGSDYTAAIIGAALDADEIEIWTDVDGIKTADPRIIRNTKQWDKVTFNEASEMAYFGAKILHPKTIKPAINKNIPVRILNTYNPINSGTLVIKDDERECIFRAISLKKNITVIRICSTDMLFAYGFLAKIFEIFNRYKLSIDLISTSEVTVSLTLDNINGNSNYLGSVISELKEIAKIEVFNDRSIICITGKDIKNKPHILKKISKVFNDLNVNIELISQGASPLSISFVIRQEDSVNIIKELHKELFENE